MRSGDLTRLLGFETLGSVDQARQVVYLNLNEKRWQPRLSDILEMTHDSCLRRAQGMLVCSRMADWRRT